MSRMPVIGHKNTNGYGWILTKSLKFTEIPTNHAILVGTYWCVLTGFLGINHTPTHIAILDGTNWWVLTGSQKFGGPPPRYFLAWCLTT